MYSCGPPHMDVQEWDDQHELTYSSYVRTRDVTLKTCQRRWVIGRNGERWSGISAQAARHDDDDVPLQMCNHSPNKATYWPWVVIHNAWGWDPGGWGVHNVATKEVMWSATLLFGPYWARRAVREAQSDQLAGHVSPLSDFCENLN